MENPTSDDALRQINLVATRLFVLHRAIASLIRTHPDPEAFAQQFADDTSSAQLGYLQIPEGNPEYRALATSFAGELLGVAQDEARRRSYGPD